MMEMVEWVYSDDVGMVDLLKELDLPQGRPIHAIFGLRAGADFDLGKQPGSAFGKKGRRRGTFLMATTALVRVSLALYTFANWPSPKCLIFS